MSASQKMPPMSRGDRLALGGVAVDDDHVSALRGRAAGRWPRPCPMRPPVTSAEVFSSDMAARAPMRLRPPALDRPCARLNRPGLRICAWGRMPVVPLISYPRQLANLADADPDRPAITDEHRTVTRAELEQLAIDTAEAFAGAGRGPGRHRRARAARTASSSSRR